MKFRKRYSNFCIGRLFAFIIWFSILSGCRLAPRAALCISYCIMHLRTASCIPYYVLHPRAFAMHLALRHAFCATSCIHVLRFTSTCCRHASTCCAHASTGCVIYLQVAPCIHGLRPWLYKVEPLRDSFDAVKQLLTQMLLTHLSEVNQQIFNCLFTFTTCLKKDLI